MSSHVIAHNIYGRAATAVLPYLMALHIGSRPVWLVRIPHADETALAWRCVKDTWPAPPHIHFAEQPLSSKGQKFAELLARFVARCTREDGGCAVFSCTFCRSLQVAELIGGSLHVRGSLNQHERGAANGLSASRIERDFPEVWNEPMHTRFPGGESLSDVLLRLAPNLIEMEQEMRPVLVVAPQSVLQVLYCYYTKRPVRESLSVKLPLHS